MNCQTGRIHKLREKVCYTNEHGLRRETAWDVSSPAFAFVSHTINNSRVGRFKKPIRHAATELAGWKASATGAMPVHRCKDILNMFLMLCCFATFFSCCCYCPCCGRFLFLFPCCFFSCCSCSGDSNFLLNLRLYFGNLLFVLPVTLQGQRVNE